MSKALELVRAALRCVRAADDENDGNRNVIIIERRLLDAEDALSELEVELAVEQSPVAVLDTQGPQLPDDPPPPPGPPETTRRRLDEEQVAAAIREGRKIRRDFERRMKRSQDEPRPIAVLEWWAVKLRGYWKTFDNRYAAEYDARFYGTNCYRAEVRVFPAEEVKSDE